MLHPHKQDIQTKQMNIEILVVKAACILVKMANQMAQLEREHPEFQPFVDNCNDTIALFKSIL